MAKHPCLECRQIKEDPIFVEERHGWVCKECKSLKKDENKKVVYSLPV